MTKTKERQQDLKAFRSVAGDNVHRSSGRSMPAPIQRRVIPHQSFTASLETDVYKDDTGNIKLKDAWATFKTDAIYNKVNTAPINVYVTNTAKDTAAYIRNIYDAENFKEHVGDLVLSTAPNTRVDAVVNFNLAKNAKGTGMKHSRPLHQEADAEWADMGLAGPKASRLPFYYIMTHEFGHVIQHIESMPGSNWLQPLVHAEPNEQLRSQLPKAQVETWIGIAQSLLKIASSENAAETLIKMPEKFPWMLFSDIIDGFIMAFETKTELPFERKKARENALRINGYLNIAIEYDNMLRHEIIPSVTEATMKNFESFPIRTEHGRERQLEKSLGKAETPAQIGKQTTKEPIADASKIMHARLQAVSQDMIEVIKTHIVQMEFIRDQMQ